jgi:methylenetetrahydrofolate reductase (NADPH)
MKSDSKLAVSIESGDFFVTAEYTPTASASAVAVTETAKCLNNGFVAINVADNHFSIEASSLATSVTLAGAGVEPIYQLVTRDRNRIALQSDLLGAASLGIKNVLCLSGYHQVLTGCPESANVYDIDSIQLIAAVKKMCDEGVLLDGEKIEGDFSMLIGAVANPSMTPIELNIIRTKKKVAAGASFIQTQAVFDVEVFGKWVAAAVEAGITDKAAIIAGVMPLVSAEQAEELNEKYTDFQIPQTVIDRLKNASDAKKEGIAVCGELIKAIKSISSVKGVHIISGGNEAAAKDVCAAAGL